MTSSLNRSLLAFTWLAALLALGAALLEDSLGVALRWSIPAAVVVTVVGVAWPGPRVRRAALAAGLLWQLALIGTYWPAALSWRPSALPATVAVPAHAWVLSAVLLVLLAAFALQFVGPAIGLWNRLRQVQQGLDDPAGPPTLATFAPLADDPQLAHRARQYLTQLVRRDDPAGSGVEYTRAGAGEFFDLDDLTQARLRLDFFRNLPGMFTGVGIIGTFAGLILGLSSFKVSGDAAAVQKSLEALLGGVWEAFLVSASAIGLAIAVTIVDRVLMASITRRIAALVQTLDERHPLLPAGLPVRRGEPAWAAEAAAVGAPSAPGPQAGSPLGLQYGAAFGSQFGGAFTQPYATQPAAAASPPPPDWVPRLEQTLSASAEANRALAEMANALPALLTQHFERAQQGQQQAAQALRSLAGRMEGVASGIEISGRKTLETVAARLMQAEMNMVSRHHGVAEQLSELVQRIETLCGLMQQDRYDPLSLRPGDASLFPGDTPKLNPLAPPAGASAGANAPLGGIRRAPPVDDGSQGLEFLESLARRADGGAWGADDPWGSPSPTDRGFGA